MVLGSFINDRGEPRETCAGRDASGQKGRTNQGDSAEQRLTRPNADSTVTARERLPAGRQAPAAPPGTHRAREIPVMPHKPAANRRRVFWAITTLLIVGLVAEPG